MIIGRVGLLSVLGLGLAYAQTQGEITGLVGDPSGAMLAGAEVTVKNVETGLTRQVQTNAAGVYRFPSLYPGVYEVSVAYSGFQTAVRGGIELQVQQVARIDFELSVGPVAESVQVTGGAPLLDTESATTGAVIENKRIVELPLNGRNFLQLVSLAPNVTYGFGSNAGAQERQGGQRADQNISVAGQRSEFNNFTLDGLVNTDPNFNTYVTLPSIDALQEFKVQTGIYPAEFGRATTQINVSTKPGTNAYHGTAFEFFRNDALDANNYAFTVNRPRKEAFVRNQFGFTLAGPVRVPRLIDGRNRLFFMANYEGLRDRKGLRQTASVVPEGMRTGDLSSVTNRLYDPATRARQPGGAITADPIPGNRIPSSRFNGKAVKLLEFYPRPNVAGAGLALNYENSESRSQDADQFITRVDFNESSQSNWFGRFSFSEESQLTPGTFPKSGLKLATSPKQFMVANTRMLSPAAVNEFRFGYSRFLNTNSQYNAFERDVVGEIGGIPGVAVPTPAIWGIPAIGITGFTGFGESTNSPDLNRNHIFQWIDNVSLVRGTHSLKAGVEVRRDRFNVSGNQFTRGQFAFGGQATQNPSSRPGTGYGFADYLLGYVQSSAGSTGLAISQLRATYQAYYLDDTWKLRRNLTLTLGLRYEIAPPYYDKHDSLISTDIRSAEDPNLRPVLIRAGAGDFYEGLPIRFNPTILVARDGRFGRRLSQVDYTDLAPRVGLSWSPAAAWTIRSGFGAFYAQDIGNVAYDLSRNGWGRRNDIANSDFPDLTLDNPFLNLSAGTIINNPFVLTANYRRRTPYVFQYLLSVQRQLSGNVVLELGYTGNQAHKLERRRMYNQPPAGPGAVQQRRPFPELGAISLTDGVCNSNYNAFSARLQQRYARGLTYLLSYTWSRSIDDSSALRAHNGDAGQQPQDSRNLRPERGLSNFHLQHRAAASLLWDVPLGKGRAYLSHSRALDLVAGGWQLGSIVAIQTGLAFTVFHGADVANAGGGTQRPDATGTNAKLPNPGPSGWLDRAAFRAPAPFTFGNVARNSAIGPGLMSWDFSAHKTFRPAEGHEIQFRLEAFNFPNRPNFGLPNPTFLNAAFGAIATTATTMREIQLGLKYVF
jgi:hypothetical protein